MADPNGATPNDGGVPAIPDLNDPNVRLDRNSAMAAIRARRQETVLADMNSEDRAAYAPSATDPALAAAAPGGDPDDTSATDAAADAERARLQAEADAAEQRRLQALVDNGNQIERAGAAADPEPAPAPAPSAPRRVLSEDELDNTYVTVKVNGVEEQISVREQRARAQKVSAADQYLEQARDTLREVKQVASQIEKQTATPSTTATTTGPESTTSDPDPASAAITALFQGDEAAAAEHLRKLAANRATPAPSAATSVDDLASQVEARLVVKRAVQEFSSKNASIVNDPIARGIANSYIAAELKREGVEDLKDLPGPTIQTVLNRAATETSNYFRRMSGLAPVAQPTVQLDPNRTAAKEQLREPPTAGARASTSAPQPQTPSDVIARMQAARAPQAAPPRR